MTGQSPRDAADELGDIAVAARKSNSLLLAAIYFTFVYVLSGFLNMNALNSGSIDAGFTYEDMQFATVYAWVMGVISGAIAFMTIFKTRIAAILLWAVIGLWWLDWALLAASGTFPGLPILPGLATFGAVIGTGAVFRYRALLRRETKTPRAPVEVFD